MAREFVDHFMQHPEVPEPGGESMIHFRHVRTGERISLKIPAGAITDWSITAHPPVEIRTGYSGVLRKREPTGKFTVTLEIELPPGTQMLTFQSTTASPNESWLF